MKEKYFLLLIISFVVFFLTISLSPPALAKKDSVNSTIGGVEIIATKKREIQAEMMTHITEWKTRDLVVQGETGKVVIPSNLIQFEVEETVNQYLKETSKPWYKIFGERKRVHLPIKITLKEEVKEYLKEAPFFYIEDTLLAIENEVSYLKNSIIEPKEVPVSKDRMERISFDVENVVGNGVQLQELVREVENTVILPGEKFSMIEILSEKKNVNEAETINFFTSVLYHVVLQTDAVIVERHSQGKHLSYSQPGIEAKVEMETDKDFVFRNDSGSPMLISASVQGQQLKIESYSFATEYEWSYSIEKEDIEPRVIYRLVADLPIGGERVLTEGEKGLRVMIRKKTETSSGKIVEEQLISKDFYPPENKVVEISSHLPVQKSPETSVPSEGERKVEPKDELIPVSPSEKSKEEKMNQESVEKDDSIEIPEGLTLEDIIYDKGGNIIGFRNPSEGENQFENE